MIGCLEFQSSFAAGTTTPLLIEHLRSCDGCLDFAVSRDGDVLFRALGGELEPPGGTDHFVEDVMRNVQLRTAESIAHRRFVPVRWLGLAAGIAAIVISGALSLRSHETRMTVPARVALAHPAAPLLQGRTQNGPIIESYESPDATIVEVPADNAAPVRMVVVFDEKLPADL